MTDTTTATELTPTRVMAACTACLYGGDELPPDGSPPEDTVIVEGIMRRFGFHPERLAEQRDEILAMLAELPEQFRADDGGGWSFLNACMDRHGRQWAGEHRIMDELFVLGQAIGAVTCPLPRELWTSMPGGMPYYTIDLNA